MWLIYIAILYILPLPHKMLRNCKPIDFICAQMDFWLTSSKTLLIVMYCHLVGNSGLLFHLLIGFK